MSDDSVILVKILRSLVYRLVMCSKVMCCFPLDRVGHLKNPSSLPVSQCSRIGHYKKSKYRHPVKHLIFESKTPDLSSDPSKSRRTSKLINYNTTVRSGKITVIDTDGESNDNIERVKFKKVKYGDKLKETSKSTIDKAETKEEVFALQGLSPKKRPKYLQNIFITKKIFSDTDASKNDYMSKNSSSIYQSQEYVFEMFEQYR